MKAANDNKPSWVVYTLADSRAPDEVRYVGITCNPTKRLRDHKGDAKRHRNHRANWIRSVLSAGGDIVLAIIRNNLSAEEAKLVEISVIAEYRLRGTKLVNGTDGGDGLLNPSLEVREKIGLASRNMSDERRAKIGAGNRGKKLSTQTKEKMRASHLGKKQPPEAIEKTRSAWIGRKHTSGSIALMSAAKTGTKHGNETRSKMSRSQRLTPPRSAHGFKGVSFDGRRGVWFAQITIDGKAIRIKGSHSTAEAAARAYDNTAFEAWGRDCYFNFPNELDAA